MRVSVCMPCYNCASFLAESLNSVIAQTWRQLEVIVCDDGSTDGSQEIAESYAGRGVRVVKQANGGASAARNRAFAESTGDCILFMDADDLISPDHIDALVGALPAEHGAQAIAMGQWDRFYNDPLEATFPDRPTYHYTAGIDFLAHGGWNMLQCAMFLLPRSAIEKHGGWNPARSPIDDFEFYTRIIAKTRRISFAPAAKVYYRSGLQGSLSTKRSGPYLEGKSNSLMLGTAWLLEAENSPQTRRACADVLQAFEHDHYPERPDLRQAMLQRVRELGGSTLQPDGPPGFQRLRRFVGWKIARRVQHAAERIGMNGAARRSKAIT